MNMVRRRHTSPRTLLTPIGAWDGDPDGTLGGDHPGSDVELGFVLKWYIQWNNDWMVSNNSRGDYTTYYDDKHDDIRYRGSDGKYFKRIWWEEDPNSSYAPYCLWPRSLNLANTQVAIDAQTYRRIEYDGERTLPGIRLGSQLQVGLCQDRLRL